MWLSEARRSAKQDRLDRRVLLRTVAAVLVLGPAIAACEGGSGFRPMYGSAVIGGNVEAKLAQVEFGLIPGRVGQRIRNELIFQGTGGGDPLPPLYRFDVTIRESVTSTLVRRDGESQSQIYNLDAKFQLVSLKDKNVILEGVSYGRAGIERNTSIFANVRAREDAENRAAKTVAQELKSRLAARLAGA